VLLAKQAVGPDIQRLADLKITYPETEFLGIVDNLDSLERIAAVFSQRSASIGLLVDIDCGMSRTGIPPGGEPSTLYRAIHDAPATEAAGFHAYDGHLHDLDPARRESRCAAALGPVLDMKSQLEAEGLSVPCFVVGGSPTFAIHAGNPLVTECSPGTTILWDTGYQDSYPDLPFQPAAFVLTRVISRLSDERFCVDLGHKAVSADKPQPRVRFEALPDASLEEQSEEHLVIHSKHGDRYHPGDFLLGTPRHICPTVSLYDHASILSDTDEIIDRWPIQARSRSLGI